MSSRSPTNLKLFVNMGSRVSMFNQMASEHMERQSENPFSGWEGASTKRKLSKEDAGYGKPIAGSKTEERGQKAAAQVRAELRELCDVIFDCGVKNKDGTAVISFGRLFTVYNVISDKCVGLLMRARKHGLVAFEGEMLFQRRDDDVIISLLKPINAIRHHFGAPPIKNGGDVPTPEISSTTSHEKANHLSVKNDEIFVDSLPVTPDSSPNLSLRTSPEPGQTIDENVENRKHDCDDITPETCLSPQPCQTVTDIGKDLEEVANATICKDIIENSEESSPQDACQTGSGNKEESGKEIANCETYDMTTKELSSEKDIPITIVTDEGTNHEDVNGDIVKVTDTHEELGDINVVNSICHEATSQVPSSISLPTVQIEIHTDNVVLTESEQETIV